MSEPTMADYLHAGLSGELLRQKAIANNIANLHTNRYRRVDTNFQELLADRLHEGESLDIDDLEPELIRPMTTPVGPNGNDVDMDAEVAEMLKNAGRMKLYLTLLKKHYGMIDSAIEIR
jgi:flagellar basal-body rod protein FlgB